MGKIEHKTAESSHYDHASVNYDKFNEEKSAKMNALLEATLRELGVKTVADMTCGTGSQVFWLHNAGFEVVGSDISAKMLEVAHAKAQEAQLPIRFVQNDVRAAHLGSFDAVLTIFNAIGHLTKQDFEKAIRNIGRNLNKGGWYIFDIFNLDYMLYRDNITKLTIDWIKPDNSGGTTRIVQYSTVDYEGVLASHTTRINLREGSPLDISEGFQTLQIYRKNELEQMLETCGFMVKRVTDAEGQLFDELSSERVLVMAQKKS